MEPPLEREAPSRTPPTPGRTHLQYAFDIHLSQLENVDFTESTSLETLRGQNVAIFAGLMMV